VIEPVSSRNDADRLQVPVRDDDACEGVAAYVVDATCPASLQPSSRFQSQPQSATL